MPEVVIMGDDGHGKGRSDGSVVGGYLTWDG